MNREAFISQFGKFLGDDNDTRRRFRQLAEGLYDFGSHDKLVDGAASASLTEDQSGSTINVGTDALTFALPAITADNLGMKFKFRNTGADAAVALTISPAAADGINGTVANAAADSVASGVVDKDLVNTKATANTMDWVEIVAVSLTKWAITGGVGIWASEA